MYKDKIRETPSNDDAAVNYYNCNQKLASENRKLRNLILFYKLELF
jgi:hypothetical protein